MNPLVVLSGIVIGFIQGLIGGGGLVFGVPALIYVVGVKDPRLAIGTSAFVVAISAVVTLLAMCGPAMSNGGAALPSLWPALSAPPSVLRLERASLTTD